MIRERPILFSDAMVRAILAGRKTQTRRPVKPQPSWNGAGGGWYPPNPISREADEQPPHARHYANARHVAKGFAADFCPYGQPGDRLWVREAWRVRADEDHIAPRDLAPRTPWYCATGNGYGDEQPSGCAGGLGKRRPPMFMPRWASRLTLEVTGVRVERLQDISEDDARAEGATMRPRCSGYRDARDGWSMDWSLVGTVDSFTRRPLTESDVSLGTARMAFANMWNAINGAESWDANPWVWAISFSVEKP